ncbi:hypothetical protein OsccyDRAFT_1889 [Leptolyngbyaceae cyanobacterium JSC-12]|nr:hypothetical protein OsccyDRAFT_1889 [Leptolyngbyaceae cyanobacterium JSC-12]
MRSPLNSSSDSLALLPASQQFLIPPFERVRFTVLFILATGFGWFLIWFGLRSVQDPLMPARAIERGVLSAVITGFVFGVVVSAMQWLVLRRYLAHWRWILAGTVGYVLLTVTLEVGWGWIGVVTNSQAVVHWFQQLSPAAVVFAAGGLRVCLTALCAAWLGMTQWLFLRQYTRSNFWWVGVPSIAVLLSSSFTFLSVLLLTAGVRLPLATNVLAAGILGTTQAIAFCALKKKTVDVPLGDCTSPLVVAPEILDYGLVKTLARQLQRRLNMAWTSEHLNDDALTYLVGVTQNGAIAAYTPLNSPAVEQLEEIPLPKLTNADQAKRTSSTEPLARFEVIFLPSGSLQVNAWLGIPLTWIAVSMMTAVLILSAIAAYSMPQSSLNLQ